MFKSFIIIGVFFLAFSSSFIQAEFAEDVQLQREVPLSTACDRSKGSASLEIQKLETSNREVQKTWRQCAVLLCHFHLEDSEEHQTIKTSLEQYPNLIYLVDNDGKNLLMHTTQANNEWGAALLVSHYARNQLLDVQDINGDSALFYAIRNQNKDIAALLIAYGARTNICNQKGFNVLQFSCTLDNLEMFYFLIGTLEKLDELKMKNQT
ncbi:MAG: ankyrin repeat domain-containing protein [Puniceicoccales bacterium]|jgi:ankyrin repeat protein|nr:ankyrin repeat domain-containing protein [Puniceicoccales bacterium]